MLHIFKKKFNIILKINFEPKATKIMLAGIRISFMLILFSTLLLAIYISTNPFYIVYDLGISLFKSASIFISVFIINGIAFSKILKDIQ